MRDCPPSNRRSKAHSSRPRGRFCTSTEWYHRPSKETSRSACSFRHRPAARSRSLDAQPRGPHDGCACTQKGLGARKWTESLDGSCFYLNRSSARRQHIKILVLDDSEYIEIFLPAAASVSAGLRALLLGSELIAINIGKMLSPSIEPGFVFAISPSSDFSSSKLEI